VGVRNRLLHLASVHPHFRLLTVRLGPGFLLAGSVENFNWITWIRPQSKVLALITGGSNGLGLNPLPSLDLSRVCFDVLWVSMTPLTLSSLSSPRGLAL
jgi:hypothetical protein